MPPKARLRRQGLEVRVRATPRSARSARVAPGARARQPTAAGLTAARAAAPRLVPAGEQAKTGRPRPPDRVTANQANAVLKAAKNSALVNAAVTSRTSIRTWTRLPTASTLAPKIPTRASPASAAAACASKTPPKELGACH